MWRLNLLNDDEQKIFEQLCSPKNKDNKEGYMRLLELSDYRRYILAYMIKKNATAMERISVLLNRCHLTHINLAFKIHRNGSFALNNTMLFVYFFAVQPCEARPSTLKSRDGNDYRF